MINICLLGAKSDVIRWFVDKKMVLSAYKQVKKQLSKNVKC